MRLIHGDAIEEMDKLIDEGVKVDAIITDPPYLHVKGGMKSKKYNRGTWSSNSKMVEKMSDFGKEKIFLFLDKSIQLMEKINMYIFCSKLQLLHYFEYISKHKKIKYDLLVWDKKKYTMKSTKFYTSDIEYVIKLYEPGVSLNKVLVENGSKSDINYYLKRQSFKQPKGLHKTMKPIELIEKYLKVSSNENDIILDPFMGSGTTGVACKNLGRDFIGIELNKKYYDIAVDRITNEVKPLI